MSDTNRDTAHEELAAMQAETDRHLEVYRRMRGGVAVCWILAGLMQVGFTTSSFDVYETARRDLFNGDNTFILLQTAMLALGSGSALIVCGVMTLGNSWWGVLGGFWITLALFLAVCVSPVCFLFPVYLMLLLQTIDFHRSARFLHRQGFHLRELPASASEA
jgi:magnesium-transporting ATPase (P-type)